MVALLMEGVDRNTQPLYAVMRQALVALLMEGVDRNPFPAPAGAQLPPSPSSWRAWIEIAHKAQM